MKQPKKLTYSHKKYLTKRHLDPELWMLQSEDSEKWVYVNKIDGSTRERFKHA